MMMRTICLYFQVHHPFRLRRYRFFDIGNEHYYYDDYANESTLRKNSDQSYLKTNKVLLETLKENKGKFKVAFSISGCTLDQFELYAPEVLESFKQLADTGMVEFLCETDSHSLASLANKAEFEKQVESHRKKINRLFGQNPTVFRNTDLIYSDQISVSVADMGFEGMITEGAKHILGWKSPNYLYCSAANPRLKLLLRNFKLSDDLSFNFGIKNWSEYPLTTEKMAHWLNHIDPKEENVNIFVDYNTFGVRQKADTGIFEFIKHLPSTVLKHTNFTFSTPSEIVRNQQPIAPISVPSPISWTDEERDITSWLGNALQQEAFHKLYELAEFIPFCTDPKILIDWKYLQASDNFSFMSTKFFSGKPLHSTVNPFGSPYDAFINFMNILSDFTLRVKNAIKTTENKEHNLDELLKLIEEKDSLLAKYQSELTHLAAKSNTENATSSKSRKAAAVLADSKPEKTEKAKKPEKKKEVNEV